MRDDGARLLKLWWGDWGKAFRQAPANDMSPRGNNIVHEAYGPCGHHCGNLFCFDQLRFLCKANQPAQLSINMCHYNNEPSPSGSYCYQHMLFHTHLGYRAMKIGGLRHLTLLPTPRPLLRRTWNVRTNSRTARTCCPGPPTFYSETKSSGSQRTRLQPLHSCPDQR